MSHTLRMLLGCLLPLALIFLLPLLGVGSGVTLTIFLVLMFACHLLMMGGHGHGHRGAGDGHRHNHSPLTREEQTLEHPERDTLHQRHQH